MWLYEKDGVGVRKKAPAKVFVEKDFYTIRAPDGGRDLRLEHGLSALESRFVSLRQNKLQPHSRLNDRDRLHLCAFIAAMFARTKSRAEHLSGQWQGALDLMKRMDAWMKEAPAADVEQMGRALGPAPGDEESSLTMEEVEAIVHNPVQMFLGPEIQAVTPHLAGTRFAIVETGDSPGFITSDAPCVWFDSELLNRSPAFGAGGLISPSIEIAMPLSPQQLILFSHQLNADGRYLPLSSDDPLVGQLNRRVCRFAHEYVVASQNVPRQPWRPRPPEQ